jgi:integrase
MQEIRPFKPSTVSRRFSVVAGFYRTVVIDGVLDHSPAEHVRRPAVPPESPTLGFTHLQFEAMLTASRESANPADFALVAMLGLLGLRIFEATSSNIADLGEEHGHRVLRVCGKGTKVVLIPLPPAVGRVAAAERAVALGWPGVQPVISELLEWIQDYNWPVARTLAPFSRASGGRSLRTCGQSSKATTRCGSTG